MSKQLTPKRFPCVIVHDVQNEKYAYIAYSIEDGKDDVDRSLIATTLEHKEVIQMGMMTGEYRNG